MIFCFYIEARDPYEVSQVEDAIHAAGLAFYDATEHEKLTQSKTLFDIEAQYEGK